MVKVDWLLTAGPNPTTSIYNATGSLARFENKNILFFFAKRSSLLQPCRRKTTFPLSQESGGTVLSTNWQEVGKSKVDVKPPDGMEFKKWDS
jgi:hypothetical protein